MTVLGSSERFKGAPFNFYQWGSQLLLISYQPCSAVSLQILRTLSLWKENLWCKAKLDLPMMCLTGTHYAQWTSGSCMNGCGKHCLYLNSAALFFCFCEAGPHSWVINRQIREAGSVAWLALTNLTAAAWLGKWLQAGMEYPDKQRRETLELLYKAPPSQSKPLHTACYAVK